VDGHRRPIRNILDNHGPSRCAQNLSPIDTFTAAPLPMFFRGQPPLADGSAPSRVLLEIGRGEECEHPADLTATAQLIRFWHGVDESRCRRPEGVRFC